jgi:hypothetical protein
MEDVDLTNGKLLSDEMKINLHMLHALMLNGAGGEVHSADVVTVDESAAQWRSLELMQELAQLGGLSHTTGDCTVLSFGAGAGDDSLLLGRLGDQVVSEEHGIARRGATSVQAASPVGVGVDDQVKARRVAQQQVKVRRPMKIAQDALHGQQVGLPKDVEDEDPVFNGCVEVS